MCLTLYNHDHKHEGYVPSQSDRKENAEVLGDTRFMSDQIMLDIRYIVGRAREIMIINPIKKNYQV